jgi:hypothetical protein
MANWPVEFQPLAKPSSNERDGLLQNFIVTRVVFCICVIGRLLVPFLYHLLTYTSNEYVFSCSVYQNVQYLTSTVHF